MAKIKIKTENWVVSPSEVTATPSGYKAPSTVHLRRSQFAKTTGHVECGFCGCEHEIYVWSLAGSGKRCDHCKALIGWGSTYAANHEIKELPHRYKVGIEPLKDNHQ